MSEKGAQESNNASEVDDLPEQIRIRHEKRESLISSGVVFRLPKRIHGCVHSARLRVNDNFKNIRRSHR